MSIAQLHVANMYGQYKQTDLSGLLQSIHDELYNKFQNIAKGNGDAGAGSSQEAKELQEFFQDVKTASNSQVGKYYLDSIQDEMKREVISQVVKMSLRTSDNPSSLFRYIAPSRKEIWRQGAVFEKQLSNVMASVLNMASAKRTDIRSVKKLASSMNWGSKIGGLDASFVDEMGRAATQEVIAEFNKTANTKNKISKYVTESRDAKIDVSGLSFTGTITAKPSSYLYKIASLLSKASFTAKSYASEKQKWVQSIRMNIITQSQNTKLHLGSAESARAFLTVLGAHMPPPVALSAYMYILNTDNTLIKAMASRLRFIYELTGYGQKYKERTIEQLLGADNNLRANYIIYNDPGSNNIFVRSTADIISELWNEVTDLLDETSIELAKDLF